MRKLFFAIVVVFVTAEPALSAASLVYAKVRGEKVVDSYVKDVVSEAACAVEKKSVKEKVSKIERIFLFCTEDPSSSGAVKASKVFGEKLPSKDVGFAMPFALVVFYAEKKSGNLGSALVKYFPTAEACAKYNLTVLKPGLGINLYHFCTVNILYVGN